jgi:hypothetical protein
MVVGNTFKVTNNINSIIFELSGGTNFGVANLNPNWLFANWFVAFTNFY